jgi:hypothetical protein
MGRGNELCSYASKVQSHQSHRKLHDTNRTREHELKLEYLKTRLGLSGLPLPLLILNHGRRKGAYQNNIPQTLDPTFPSCRTSDCPRVRRVSKRRSSTLSLARVCVYFTLLAALISTDSLDWYDIKAPSIFEVKNVGKTLANRSQGLSMSDQSHLQFMLSHS